MGGPLSSLAQKNAKLRRDGEAGKGTIKELKSLLEKNKELAEKFEWSPERFNAAGFNYDLIIKIMEFQEKLKIKPVDGEAGPKTIEKLPKLPVGENKILEFLFKFTDEIENELV